MNTSSRDNPFDAFRKVIEHEANQDDDGGFVAKLYGFQPEHDDDGPSARGFFQKINKDAWEKANPPIWASKGGHIPGRTGHGPTIDQFIEQERKRIQARNKIRRSYLYPQVGKIGNHFWYWKCRQHEQLQFSANWGAAYQAATHHAHNHHRSQK